MLSVILTVSGQNKKEVGDIGSSFFRYSVNNPDVNLNALTGSDNYWDLSFLRNLKSDVFNFKHADYGSSISIIGEAELLVDNADSEYFYDVEAGNLILKGSSKIEIKPGHYYTGVAEGYYDIHNDVFSKESHSSSSKITVELYEEDLQESGLSDLNPFDYQYIFTRHIDQELLLTNRGTLVLPSGTYTVDQVTIERTVNQYLSEKKHPFRDEKTILPSNYSDTYGEHEIRFYVSDLILPICKVFIDEERKITRIELFDFNSTQQVELDNSNINDQFVILNNPTFGKATLSINVRKPGIYHLEVKNILGSTVHREKIEIENTLRLPVDFTFLEKGSYFCSLVNEVGSTVISRKLVILKP